MQHIIVSCAETTIFLPQDTLVGFEALAAYALSEKNRFIYQMEITIESTYVPGWSYNVSFTSENFAQAHHIEVYSFFGINHIHSINNKSLL